MVAVVFLMEKVVMADGKGDIGGGDGCSSGRSGLVATVVVLVVAVLSLVAA